MVIGLSPDGSTIFAHGHGVFTRSSPDGKTQTTTPSNGLERTSLWPLPGTYPDNVPGISLWAKMNACAELDAEGTLRPFDADAWARARLELERIWPLATSR
jgi:hypothetical protein